MPNSVRLIGATLTAFVLTLVLTPFIRAIAVRYGLITRPAEDRWGKRVIARLGGVAMFLSFLAAVVCWVPLRSPLVLLLAALTLSFCLGLFDDLRRLPPYSKLIAQLLIGSLLVTGGIRIELIQWTWLSIPLSILWFVLIMNAFNLLDNMDGLAAGIGAIAAGFCAVHAGLVGQWMIAMVSAALSATCIGFLRYNFPPARIFMGDSGSHSIGLCLGALAIMQSWHHSAGLLSILAIPSLVLAVPIFDTCFVTIQRLMNRQNPFVGGTDHVSHRLAILGLSVEQTVLVLYGLSLTLGILSFLTAALKPLPMLACWVFIATTLVLCGQYLAKVNVYRLEPSDNSGGPARAASSSARIETMLMHKRRLLEILVDFCALSCVYVFAHLLRFDGVLTHDVNALIMKSLPLILVIKLSVFVFYGLYRGLWRYLGLADLLSIVKAVSVGSCLSAVTILYLWRFQGFSRSVTIIDWALSILVVGGSRVAERLFDEWITQASPQQRSVVIVGAGDSGAQVLRMLNSGNERFHVLGFIDDDRRKHGSAILGVPVLGGRDHLQKILKRGSVSEVLVAITDPPGELLEDIRSFCTLSQVNWRVVSASVRSL